MAETAELLLRGVLRGQCAPVTEAEALPFLAMLLGPSAALSVTGRIQGCVLQYFLR